MRYILCIALLLGSVPIASAHPPTALNAYFRYAREIYLAKVSHVSATQITFTITNVLRGDSTTRLTLRIDGYPTTYREGTEFILVSSKGESNTVGWTTTGYCGWIPGEIVRIDEKIYVKDSTTVPGDREITLDQLPDGSKGLSLDHITQFLKAHPQVEPF